MINSGDKLQPLTHWGRVMHICISKVIIIGSDNGLSPSRCQAIIWTNAGTLLTATLGPNCNENLIEIQTFSFKKIHFKMSSGKWRPFCLGLNVLKCRVQTKVSVNWYTFQQLKYNPKPVMHWALSDQQPLNSRIRSPSSNCKVGDTNHFFFKFPNWKNCKKIYQSIWLMTWRSHDMEILSTSLALCEGIYLLPVDLFQ